METNEIIQNSETPDNRKKKKNIFILTTILFLATTLILCATTVVFFYKYRTKSVPVSNIKEDNNENTALIEQAKEEEHAAMLDMIQSKLSSGVSALGLFKELFPNHIVYLNSAGDYAFSEIDDSLKKNNYARENFSIAENGDISYAVDNSVISHKGIDISHYNPSVNFARAKEAGVEYAMIRCGYRAYGSGVLTQDRLFNQHISNALKNDIEVGVYFFSQAISVEEAVEEANYVIDLIKPYNVTYPVAIDIEDIYNDTYRQQDLTQQELTDVAIAFCDTIKAAGYTPMIYCNLRFFVEKLDLSRLESYEKWFAYYADMPYFPYDFSMWQYSNTGEIDGISGDVDINLSFKSFKK